MTKSLNTKQKFNIMETNYTLKRLKLLGPLFAVFFAVFMFGSFRAEAQTVEVISGSQDVCISAFGTSAATTYTAAVNGNVGAEGTWVWDIRTAYGSFVSSTNTSTVQAEWTIQDSNIPGGLGGANFAWLRARFTPVGGTQIVSPYYPVNLWVDVFQTFAASDIDGVCFDGGDGVINLTGTYIKYPEQDIQTGLPNGGGGQWNKISGPGDMELIFEDQFAPNTNVSAQLAGVYEVVWSITNGTCITVTSDPITIEFYPDPEAIISSDPSPAEVCLGESVELFGEYNFVAAYQWFFNGEEIPGATDPTFTATEAGAYYVEVWSDENCGPEQSNTIEVVISDLEAIALEINDDDLFWCEDADISAELTAVVTGEGQGDLTFVWFLDGVVIPDASESTYIAEAFGTYSVTVYDEFGCETEGGSNEITISPLPLPEFELSATTVCADAQVVVTVEGENFIEAESMFVWDILETAYEGVSEDAEFELPLLAAGVYTVEVTVINENGCESTESIEILVNALPVAVIDGDNVLCFDEEVVLSLTDIENVVGSWTVTWYVDGEPVVTLEDEVDFTFNPEALGLDPYATVDVEVVAHIINELGCHDFTAPFIVTVLEIPNIVNNNILAPQVGQVEKIVFCTQIPKDDFVLKGDGEPSVNDNSCAAIMYKWEWRPLGTTAWLPAAGDNNKASYQLPQHGQSVQYRRLAKGILCDGCADETDWFASNVITLQVVPQIAATIETIPSETCLGEEIQVIGNILYVYEYDDLGEQGDPMAYVTGEWAPVAGITFHEDLDVADNVITADDFGAYELTWALTPKNFVYTECQSPDPDYCCKEDETTAIVVFEGVELVEVDNFGIDAELCEEGDPVVLILPDVVVFPDGIEFVYSISVNGVPMVADNGDYVFNPEVPGVYTFVFEVVTTGGCTATAYAVTEVLPLYEVILVAVPEEGGVVEGAGMYCPLESATVEAIPNTGWLFINWTDAEGDEVTADAEYTFDMPHEDVELFANFEIIDYTVTLFANPVEGGDVSGDGVYNYDDDVTVVAEPNIGWMFINWTDENGDEVSTDYVYEFSMPNNDVELTANFEIVDYTVTLIAYPVDEAGTLIGAGIYNYDDPVSVEAIANDVDGWSFIEWIDEDGNFVADTEVYAFTMPDNDVTLIAVFEQAPSCIGGQVRYFNQFGTPMPSPSCAGFFIVELHDENGLVDVQNARFLNGKLSAFQFCDLPVGTYTIKVYDQGYLDGSNSNCPLEGSMWYEMSVNSGDALIAQQMGTFMEMPTRPWLGDANEGYSPFGVRLGDVSGDEVVNVVDAFMIMQRLVGQIPDFGDVPDFQVSAAFGPIVNPRLEVIPEMLFELIDGKYVGEVTIGFGDHIVDLFYIASADLRARSIPQQRESSFIYMEYEGVQNVNIGDEVIIPVALTGDANVGAMTIDIEYDSRVLDIHNVVGDEIIFNVTGNTITIASVSGKQFRAGEALVNVHATVTGDITAADRFFEAADRSELVTPAVELIEGVNFTTTALVTGGTVNVPDVAGQAFEVTNYPNPFKDQTIIRYVLPETAKVQLVVYNQQGQIVRTLVNETQEANTYEVVFESDALIPGMYFYRIVAEGASGTYQTSKSMVIMR